MKKLQFLIVALAIWSQLPVTAFAQNKRKDFQSYISVSDKPDEENPNRKTVREFVVGEIAYFAFAASGMERNSDGEVSLSASIDFITPNEEILFSESKYALTKKLLPVGGNGLLLSKSFDVGFDETDPLGIYTLNLTVTDAISGQSTSTRTTILLFSSEQAKRIVMNPVNSAKHLDDLWGLYFKTKNQWAIKRIISSIRLKDSKDMETTLVGRAAIWSLESNALQDKEVYDICKRELDTTNGRVKELLSDIITVVDSKKK